MNIFIAEITQGYYEDIFHSTKVFSSKKQCLKWLENYYTKEESVKSFGPEYCQIKEVELNTNKLVEVNKGFYLPTTDKTDYSKEDLKIIHQHIESGLINYNALDWRTKAAYDLAYPDVEDLELLQKLKNNL
jgi:hypothetical protein